MDDDDYAALSAGEMAAAVADRRVSAMDLYAAARRAIEARDGAVNAVVVRDFDRARAAAAEADTRAARGERAPLLGVPVTVKESHYVAGLPTTWGLEPFRGWTPAWDGTAVARLKAAGAVVMGKTNVPPGLADVQSANPIYGRTVHPGFPDRTPGGSSGGGAAALASGMIPLELGSDIAGSIRIPAHFCGVYGHKPTFDLIPQMGHAPPGLPPGRGVELAVVGPMARRAEDLELALRCLAGPGGPAGAAVGAVLPPSRTERAAPLRYLVLDRHPLAEADQEVLDGVERAAARLDARGAVRRRAQDLLSALDLGALHGLFVTLLTTIAGRGAPRARGPGISALDWMNLLSARDGAATQWGGVFTKVDVVLCPPFGTPAFAHTEAPFEERTLEVDGRAHGFASQMAWSGLATLPGLPATVAPAGRSRARRHGRGRRRPPAGDRAGSR